MSFQQQLGNLCEKNYREKIIQKNNLELVFVGDNHQKYHKKLNRSKM